MFAAAFMWMTACSDDSEDKKSSGETENELPGGVTTDPGEHIGENGAYCYEKCPEQAAEQCVSGNVVVCEKDANGCAKWVVQTICSATQTCQDGQSTCSERGAAQTVAMRFMAGNITTGKNQTYDLGHGTRIFKALRPDIAMIQEFNLDSMTREQWVQSTFGEEYSFVFSPNNIPNGIISKYPITDSGYWETNVENARNWDWAVIDIPGSRDLLAISVHLHTSKNAEEYPVLIQRISEKQKEGNYHVVIAGDFNTSSREEVLKHFDSVFNVRGPWPVDQTGREGTDANRNTREIENQRPLDWVLLSHDLDRLEIPITIGAHTYADGHVFDSRVYASCSAHDNANELSDVFPVEANDSGFLNMQHMAVIRDVAIPVE